MLDWRAFLDQHRIPYSEKGRNISKGNIAVKCPWCSDDPSMHLNISLRGDGYNCWRDSEHRGRNEAYLVHALLRIPLSKARELVYGEEKRFPTEDDFAATMDKLFGEEYAKPKPKSLEIPKAWRPLYGSDAKSPARRLALQYLIGRGYPQHDAEALAQRFDIHYAVSGEWIRRVIFPVRDEHGHIVNFTGRSVMQKPLVRYKTVDRSEAILHMSECLFDYHTLNKIQGKVLVVCEGPFDALRISWIGEPFGIFATCIFTQNVSEGQAERLRRLASRFERVGILFDRGAELQAQRAQFELGFERFELPEYRKVKDPADLTGGQALMFARSLVFS